MITKISISSFFLLIFLSAIATQEALAQTVTFEIEVEVVTGPPKDKCPPAYDPVDGATVTVTVSELEAYKQGVLPGTRIISGLVETVSGTTSGGRCTVTGRMEMNWGPTFLSPGPPMTWYEYLFDPFFLTRRVLSQPTPLLPLYMIDPDSWNIEASVSGCPPGYSPVPPSRTVTANRVTGSLKTGLHVSGHVLLFCRCDKRLPAMAALMAPPRDMRAVLASVAVMEEEKVQVAGHVGGEAVAAVMVNDEPKDVIGTDKGIPVNPGDVIQLLGSFGHVLAHFTCEPKREPTPPPSTPPVVECPAGKPTAVSVPGNYTGTSIENIAVTTGPVTTGQEKPPAVTPPKGEVVLAPGPEELPALEPVLKTEDTVIAAGQLDNSAIGSNAISVIDKTTGAVLGQAQINMWRLAGASLNPPVVNKGQDTNLRLDVFGPPDLQLEVTATAEEGLTPKQLTATAPISVLQSQGLGAFTATKAGTHSVSVKALPIIYGKPKPGEKGLPIIYGK